MKKEIKEALKKYFLPKQSLRTSRATQKVLIGFKAFTIIVAVALVARIAILQFVQDDTYAAEAYSQQYRGKTIAAARGTIYDRNGNTLAVSVSAYSVTVNRKQIKSDGEEYEGGQDEYIKFVARGISELLDMEYSTVYARLINSNTYWLAKSNID